MSRLKKENNFFEGGVINETSMLAYLNNQLSAGEKQQFEKLLKDDPFAQEALEGLQTSQNETAVSTTLISLNKKIRERIGLKDKRTFQIHWTNYAWAAVLLGLLIGIGFVMINFIGKRDSNIAMNKEAVKKPEEPGLFETKQELKPAEIPVTVITDSVHTVQPLQTEAPRKDEAKEKNIPIQTVKTVTAAEVKETRKENTGGAMHPVTAISGNATAADAAPATTTADKTMESAKPTPAADPKTEDRLRVTAPATQKVTRGGIVEREEVGNATVITMDDAMKNFNSGNYKQSGEQFDAILQQHPANADALYFGGISDYINGNTRKSEKNFDRLLKDGTKFIEGSKWYKANILIQKGKREEAKKLLDELSQSNGSYKERAVKKKAEIEF